MRLATLAFLSGIILLQGMATLPVDRNLWWIILCLPLFTLRLLRLPLFILLGFGWALFRSQLILQQNLPTELEKTDVLVTGELIGLPRFQGRYQQFQFQVEALSVAGRSFPSPGLIRLNWYDTRQGLQAGDRYRFTIRMKRPNGTMNPAAFDYEGWLFQQRIRATGYVRNKQAVEYLGLGQGISARLHRFRAATAKRLQELSLPTPARPLLQALVLGERNDVSDAQWQVLRATGTSHLLAISGLHIGLISGLAFWLARWLWSRSVTLMLQLPAPQAAAVFATLTAIVYAALAGFSIPTQRALIMVMIIMWGKLSRRRYAPGTVLATAALAVMIWDPLATLSAGFWLSFVAVASIFLLLSEQAEISLWRRWGRVQWGVFLGLLPFLLFWFQGLSLSAPLLNLLAIPWLSLLVMPLLFAAVLVLLLSESLAQILLHLAQYCLDGLWWCLQWAAQWSWLYLNLPAPVWWQVLLASLGCIWLLLPRGVPARWLGMVWLLPLLINRSPDLNHGELHFALLDVGQGLSAVIETRNHVLVFDTGPGYAGHFNSGDAIVLPYLRSRGHHRLDTLVVSHGDNDHIGGSAAIRSAMPDTQTLSSVPHLLPGSQFCQTGQAWDWDGVQFEILHPGPVNLQAGRSENDLSCVLKVSNAYGSILLTGDIEAQAEESLLHGQAGKLRADYLVAPHHGSLTSSSKAFIAEVKPRYVLFPVGYLNRYGFPHKDVVQRYNHIPKYDTAHSGAVFVTLSAASDGRPVGYRQIARRYWHRVE